MPSLTGTPGNDIFTGGIDNDTAAGLGGSDSLSGADGGDVLAGGSGADTLDGGAGEDVLYSGDQSPAYNLPWYNNNYVLPLMDTGTEVDVLRGGDGSDRIFAGYGDSVDGGTNRTYGMGDYLYISFQGAPAGVTADFHQTTLTIGGGVITNMEYVSYAQGSQFGDNLTMPGYTGGYSDFTALSGMGGDDTLTAGYETGSLLGDEGDDVLDGRPSQYLSFADGGVGNDTIYMPTNSTAAAYGGAGEDTIYAQGVTHGGAGDDTITMQASYYGGLVYGDEGDDRITASPWGSSIAGGSGSDVIVGGDANDQLSSADFAGLSGGAADDLGLEHDQVSGGAGNDALAIGYGDDADGGAGADTLRLSLGGLTHGVDFDTSGIVSGQPFTLGGGVIQNVETLLSLRGTDFADTLRLQTESVLLTVNAGAGDDVIISQASSVSVQGGDGDDLFTSGIAADIFDGGAGADTVDYRGAASAVTADLTTGVGAGGDSLTSVESILGSAFGDVLSGSGGANTLDGGGGVDTVSYGSARAAVTVSLALQNQAQSTGGAGVDTLRNFEDLTGSAFNDTLAGDAGNNALDGGAGVDTLSYASANGSVTVSLAAQGQAQVTGAGGTDTLSNFENLTGSAFNDTLSGDAGANTLDGGGGSNVLDGGAGVDTATYAAARAGVTVSLALAGQAQATGGAGTDRLANIENLTGSAFGDTLTGDAGDNIVTGGAGANFLTGGDGQDQIVGGADFDRENGNAGNDSVDGAAGDDWVTGGKDNDVLFGGEGGDILNGNLGSDTGDGGAGADVVRGGQGDDVLSGGAGDDYLTGDLGNDTLTGGTGADAFRAFAGGGHDVITDFNRAEGDRIVLDPGTTFTAVQQGADVLVTLNGGDELLVKNVTLSALTPGWIA